MIKSWKIRVFNKCNLLSQLSKNLCIIKYLTAKNSDLYFCCYYTPWPFSKNHRTKNIFAKGSSSSEIFCTYFYKSWYKMDAIVIRFQSTWQENFIGSTQRSLQSQYHPNCVLSASPTQTQHWNWFRQTVKQKGKF